MPDQYSNVPDFRFLHDASARLLGYFVHTWYRHYLNVIEANFNRWHQQGIIRNLVEPTESGASLLFDFNALDIEKLAYILGIYMYILACHKGANFRLMNRLDGKQVLYLRGYDFEGSLALSGNMAMGFSSVDSSRFNWKLGELLAPHFALFKVLSPKDVYYETASAQRYFYGDYNRVIQLARSPFLSIYLNALSWKEGVLSLLDRMDHFVVYVSSITESALWELEQLDTDERRRRVTVVFDEEAIRNKEIQLGFQHEMQEEDNEKLIWSKQEPAPHRSMDQLREQLSSKFLLTTPEEFEKNILEHRRRISEDPARLPPGQRETWLDFRFHPALDADKLKELRTFSDWVQSHIAACTGGKGISCLALFLNHIQLRIYMTLLLGEHDETGRALAAYSAVMQAAFEYYSRPGDKIGDLSEEGRERHLGLLEEHNEFARYSGVRLLAFGKSHQFDDFSATATANFDAIFDSTKAAVNRFFENIVARTRPGHR